MLFLDSAAHSQRPGKGGGGKGGPDKNGASFSSGISHLCLGNRKFLGIIPIMLGNLEISGNIPRILGK
jgi:hypothetical protein